jgi:hypothetical protein
MSLSKKDCDKSAKENWQLAHEWDQRGEHAKADAARERAIEDEKSRDSWWYRVFGW